VVLRVPRHDHSAQQWLSVWLALYLLTCLLTSNNDVKADDTATTMIPEILTPSLLKTSLLLLLLGHPRCLAIPLWRHSNNAAKCFGAYSFLPLYGRVHLDLIVTGSTCESLGLQSNLCIVACDTVACPAAVFSVWNQYQISCRLFITCKSLLRVWSEYFLLNLFKIRLTVLTLLQYF